MGRARLRSTGVGPVSFGAAGRGVRSGRGGPARGRAARRGRGCSSRRGRRRRGRRSLGAGRRRDRRGAAAARRPARRSHPGRGLRGLTLGDPGYPARLRRIDLPPPVLFVARRRRRRSTGARRRDRRDAAADRAPGARRAARIADAIAGLGATVVSGLALGIDAAAHAAAVAPAATTVAVIGGGHARLYPAAHAAGERDRRARRRGDQRVRAGDGAEPRHVPAAQPDHQRARGRDGRGRGRCAERRPDDRGVGAGAGARAAHRARAPRRPRGRPAASRSCGRPGRRRASWPAIAELIEDLGPAARGAGTSDRARARPGRRSAVGHGRRRVIAALAAGTRRGRALVVGHGSVDELVAVTGQPGATVLGVLTALESRGLAVEALRAIPRGRGAGGTAAPGRGAPSVAALRDRAAGPDRRAPRLPRGRPRCYPPRNPATRSPSFLARLPIPSRRGCGGPPRAGSRSHGGEVLRKVGAAVLAVPVLVAIYLATLRARGGHRRISPRSVPPRSSPWSRWRACRPRRRPPSPASAPAPVTARMLDAVRTGHTVTAPIHVGFDTPMDAASVAGALADRARRRGQRLVGRRGQAADHRPHGALAARHAVHGHDRPGRRSEAGGSSGTPVRAVVAHRGRGRGDDRRRPRSQGPCPDRHRVHDQARPCDPVAAVRAALRIEPAVDGRLEPGATHRRVPLHAGPAVEAGDRSTASSSTGLVDADGLPFSTRPRSRCPTVAAPSRGPVPAGRTGREGRAGRAALRPFHAVDGPRATAAGVHGHRGRQARRRQDHLGRGRQVLVFRPTAPLAVRGDRRDDGRRDGAVAGRRAVEAATATFSVVPKPAPAPKPKAAHRRLGQRQAAADQPLGGGGGASAGSWAAVETYYLRLMNCTRTGGWVTSGGVLVAGRPERRAAHAERGDLAHVSRPYAKPPRDQQPCRPLHRRQPRRPPARRRLRRATAGPRTSAAGRATRSAPCSGRTCSSRARGRTTAATTGT